MVVPDKIKTFLTTTKDISFGYNEINFYNADNLMDEQIGYSIDTNGKSLTTGNDDDWQKEWLVIASDSLGDPIIIDTSSAKLTVLSAAHGEGEWEAFVIADSLDNFKDILSLLTIASKDRTNPVDLEQNPLTSKEQKDILRSIKRQNPDTELSYWEAFFENV